MACINNLRQIDAAETDGLFAKETDLKPGDEIRFTNASQPFLKLSRTKITPCPSGGIYRLGENGKPPTCSLGSTVTPAHILP